MPRSWWWKAVLFGAVTLLSCLAILPTVAPRRQPAVVARHYTRRIQKGLDLQGGLRLVYAVDGGPADDRDAVATSMEIIRRRVDKLGLSEPNIMRKDHDIVVELPGLGSGDFQRIAQVVGSTAQLQFKLVDDEADDYLKAVIARLPAGGPVKWARDPWTDRDSGAPHDLLCLEAPTREDLTRFLATVPDLSPPPEREWGFEELVRTDDDGEAAPRKLWRSYLLHRQPGVTGADLIDADEIWDPMGRPLVGFTMDGHGTTLMERLTGDNVGRRMAIVLDDRIASAPRIDERIGKHGSITVGGALDPAGVRQQVKDLVTVLRCGALPIPLRWQSKTQIGPTLGDDTVASARLALGLGAGAVMLFMMLYYRLAGVFANVAMLLNMLYMLAILAVLEAALTLPGIAGLVLTVGMAVDANIIVYERIREELRLGRPPRAAVHAGFSRAFWTVFDAHVTNFIAGVVLFSLGSGPVRGFALTLLIGIVTNLFTSIWLSRWMFELVVGRRGSQPATLSIRPPRSTAASPLAAGPG